MWGKIVRVVIVLVAIFIFAANVLAGDKFYYGGFGAHEVLNKFPDLRDSLRFNLVDLVNADSSHRIDSLAKYSLKGLVEQTDPNSPTWWSKNSYYTIWEAEGFPGSRVNLSYPSGSLVNDPEAHDGAGSYTRLFSNPNDSGMVQTGPTYRQYGSGEAGTYFVDFNLKFRGNRSVPTREVCKIMVNTSGSILKEDTLVVGDFPTGGYKKFQLQYTLPDFRNTQFKIYWYGVDTLFIDYVEVYNRNGQDLMSGAVDQRIKEYVQQSWTAKTFPGTNDTVIYRWYLKDEPQSIDCYMPYAHIDSLLRDNLPHIPGAQYYGKYPDTSEVYEYLTRENPVEYMIDPYPFGPGDTTDSAIQSRIDWLAKNFNEGKRKAESLNKDFWVAIQAHAVGNRKADSPCPSGQGVYYYHGVPYCIWQREPTANELRLQTFLALCYGTDAVMNYQIPYSLDNTKNPPYLETGLYDIYASAESLKITDKWKEIKNFTGPRAEKLGPILKGLIWQGACRGDTAQWFYLRDTNLAYLFHKENPPPQPKTQIGFFRTSFFSSDPDYFLVVSRDPSIGGSCKLVLNPSGSEWGSGEYGYEFYIYDAYRDSVIDYLSSRSDSFDCYLEPGEGRLFRVIDKVQRGYLEGNVVWGSVRGSGIYVDDDIIVDTGATLRILPGTRINIQSSSCTLIVYGTLEALGGTGDSTIEFFPPGGSPHKYWGGIVVMPEAKIKMKNVNVNNARVGLTLDGVSGDTVSNCTFSNSSQCGIKLKNSNAMICYNIIEQDTIDSFSGDTGIYMENINTGASWRVGLNYITGYDYGIYAKSCNTQIATNTIDQGVIGIYVRNCPSYLLLGTNHLNGRLSTSYIYCKKSKADIIECELKGTSNTTYGIIYDSTNGGYMRSTKIWDYDNYGAWVKAGSSPPPNLGTIPQEVSNWFENCGSAYVYNSATQWLSAKYNYWNTVPPCKYNRLFVKISPYYISAIPNQSL
jgi:parallel beta-helix repeat protein